MKFHRTDGKDKNFIENCRLLDKELDRRVGKKIERDKYKKYNQLDIRKWFLKPGSYWLNPALYIKSWVFK